MFWLCLEVETGHVIGESAWMEVDSYRARYYHVIAIALREL